MFYNFNRHKQKANAAIHPKTEELAVRIAEKGKVTQRKLADLANKKLSRLSGHWQRAIFLVILGSGAGYCAWLTVPNFHGKEVREAYQNLFGKSNSIRAATPSPRQQAFENYLDSLERAFIADSIYHSQQNINGHAE